MQRDIEALATTRERGVVGSFEINIDQRQTRPQETLRLTKRKLEDKAQRQGSFYRVVGELSLGTSLAGWCRFPRGDGILRDPQSDVASLHECTVVVGPPGWEPNRS
jgi:hypothetical protein